MPSDDGQCVPKENTPMRYYAIRDRKAEATNRIFHSPTHATAMREIADGLRNEDHLRDNAGDFILRYIGDLDPATDCWDLEGAPNDVVEVAELVST